MSSPQIIAAINQRTAAVRSLHAAILEFGNAVARSDLAALHSQINKLTESCVDIREADQQLAGLNTPANAGSGIEESGSVTELTDAVTAHNEAQAQARRAYESNVILLRSFGLSINSLLNCVANCRGTYAPWHKNGLAGNARSTG
jgi:hypothetical protein